MSAELDFIIGRSGTGKTYSVLQDIQNKMSENPLGSPLVLLTPEHMTYKLERKLVEGAPNGGYFRAHVFGFRRFARQVLVETGKILPKITDVGRRLLLRRLLLEHHKAKDLNVFARASNKRGFTLALSDAIKEIKSYQLDTDTLRSASSELKNNSSRLASKVNELAMLADEFNQAMAEKSDAEDMMNMLATTLPSSRLIKNAEVYLDGFIFFNPQELNVLATILSYASKVHITLPMLGENINGNININLAENTNETGLFNRSYRTYWQVVDLARAQDAARKIKITVLNGNKRADIPALKLIEQKLFTREKINFNNADGVKLVEAANPRLEVEAVAADILRLVREENYRYSDIGVLVRDGDTYNSLLELVFEGAAIPFFHDSKRPSVHHQLAELLRSVLEVVTKGWRYETIFRVLRTGFFPVVAEDIDKLENYVLEFGIRGRNRWTQAKPWDWHRRYALAADGDKIDDATREKIAYIDSLRQSVSIPLANFDDAVRKAKNVEESVTALYNFFIALNVPEHLEEWSRLAEEKGELAVAREHHQIWQDILDLFDQLVEINGDENMPLTDFAAILGDGLDALELSLIPPGLDYVTIASFDQNSLDNTRAIFIIGATLGVMPRRNSEQGLFTDADRLHLDTVLKKISGKEISRGGAERSFGEKFLMYRSFNEGRDYLWVSYPLADKAGAGLTPSPLVKRLRELFIDLNTVGEKFISIPLETLERTDDLQLAAPKLALSGLATALRGKRDGRDMPDFWRDVYNWALDEKSLKRQLRLSLSGLFAHAVDSEIPPEIARLIYPSGKILRGSVTQFEKFSQCPFAHFASYGLKLQERRTYKLGSIDLGQLFHEVLRAYGEQVKTNFGGKWQDVPENVRRKLCLDLVEQIAPRLQSEILLSQGSYMHLKTRIARTVMQSVEQLTAWAAVSKFQPAYFEEAFGHAADTVKLTPLPLGGGYSLSFKGQIDRLDIHQTSPYFIIVDYKSGTAAINIFEVYYGLKLQLLVYALVAKELLKQQGEDRLPAGILYSFLQNPIVPSENKLSEEKLVAAVRKKLKMPGWVLADIDVIKAIDEKQEHIAVKLTRNDEVAKNTKKSVRTLDEFALLLGYVDYILKSTGKDILAGNIKASPYRYKDKTACDYCSYRDLCGFDLTIDGYEFNDINVLDDSVLEDSMARRIGREDLLNAIHARPTKGD